MLSAKVITLIRHMLLTYQCIISPRAPWGRELTAFQPKFIYYQTAHIHFTFIITIVTMNEYLCTGALEPSGDRFIRSTSEGDLLRQHSPTLRCYLKSTLSTCHRMCPEISFVNKQAWNGLQNQYNVFPVPFSTFHIYVLLDHSPAGHGSDG